MKQLIAVAVLILAAWVGLTRQAPEPAPVATPASPQVVANDSLSDAIEQRRSNVQVEGAGTVFKLLRDDNEGSRHQKFLVRVAGGRTILIAHNIDLAPRVAGLAEGDQVRFFGEYEWNERGGVVHWTHDDPQGRHMGGWIEHQGRRYH